MGFGFQLPTILTYFIRHYYYSLAFLSINMDEKTSLTTTKNSYFNPADHFEAISITNNKNISIRQDGSKENARHLSSTKNRISVTQSMDIKHIIQTMLCWLKRQRRTDWFLRAIVIIKIVITPRWVSFVFLFLFSNDDSDIFGQCFNIDFHIKPRTIKKNSFFILFYWPSVWT